MSDNGRDVHTATTPAGTVELSLSQMTGPSVLDPVTVRLRVEDSRSGELLVQVDLDATQFTRLVGAHHLTVPNALLSPHPERIGKRMQNIAFKVDRTEHEDVDQEAEKRRRAFLSAGWHSVRIDKTNYGRRVVAYRWISDEEATP